MGVLALIGAYAIVVLVIWFISEEPPKDRFRKYDPDDEGWIRHE